MLAQPDASTRPGHRDLFLMTLLYDTGMRVGEVLSSVPGDVRTVRGSATITVRGKGRKVRVVPLMDETVDHLQSYMRRFHDGAPPGTPLFYVLRHGSYGPMSDDNVSRIVAKHAKAARESCPSVPERVTPHMYRHSRALALYRSGVPLPLISEWLGHADLSTTLIYAYADTEMEREAIQAAMDQGHPLRNIVLGDAPELDDDAMRRLYGLL